MHDLKIAEWILARVTASEQATSIVGDLAEQSVARGSLWFWCCVLRTVCSCFWHDPKVSVETRTGIVFGIIIGGLWTGLLVMGNLAGTSVFGNIRDSHAGVYGSLMSFFPIGAIIATALVGFAAALRTGTITGAWWVGFYSGLISGVISLVTIMSITILFHDAMMLDPSNIHEFAHSARRTPTQAELSSFLYWDALGGGLNMLWICPLLGVTIGTIGALFGKATFASFHRSSKR